jgi:hypothetical protein
LFDCFVRSTGQLGVKENATPAEFTAKEAEVPAIEPCVTVSVVAAVAMVRVMGPPVVPLLKLTELSPAAQVPCGG